MVQYLQKFAGTINKRQSQQILKLLNAQRDTGQIRSVKEFTQKLETLVKELTSTILQPSLKVWAGGRGKDIDSESYNFMLERVDDDLNAVFEEAINIDEVQRSHEAIIRDVILKNIKAGVAELESKVDLFEFINRDIRGFDSAIFSTFRESKNERTQRQGIKTQTLFRDPRNLNEIVPTSEDARVDLIGERLTLATDNNILYTINNVRQIFDSESPQSELIVELPGNNLNSIIDNTKGTYWIQSLLFSTKKNFVKTKLEFSLGGTKEVNYIEIEPAAKYNFILEAVHFIDANNLIVDLGINEIVVNSSVTINLRKIVTNRIILTFRNENCRYTEFQYNEKTQSLFTQTLNQPVIGFSPSLERVSKDLSDVIPSDKVKEVIGLKSIDNDIFGGYEFVVGIDNVRIGLAKYLDRSIYVSTPLSLLKIGEIGLKSSESRSYLERLSNTIKYSNVTYDIDQDPSFQDDESLTIGEQSNVWFQNSIEYWIFKLDYNSENIITKTTIFPILPLDTDRIYHERLVLNEKSDVTFTENNIGSTMFFTNRLNGNIKVYRNGTLIEDTSPDFGDGWCDISESVDRLPDSGSPMRFKIQITNVLPGDIYTISYNPILSSTRIIPKTITEFTSVGGLNIVDLVGDLTVRACSGQIIGLDEQEDIFNTEAYLVIILRQNTSEQTLTPAVEEYTLVAGKIDQTKFEVI